MTRTLHQGRWNSVVALANHLCQSGDIPCAAIATGTESTIEGLAHVGLQRPGEPGALRDDAIFLVASITKPIVAMAALQLMERGLMTLADRVSDTIPEFGREGKYGVELRHLLTHTSGLPDMLPDNLDLRKAHATLGRYVERTCEEALTFPPGRNVQYQSMGFAILGEIMRRVTGRSCSQWLSDELLKPLGMQDSSLGAPDSWFEGKNSLVARVPLAIVPESQIGGEDWNWNSRYWRQLGAPWGGLLTSAQDLARFAQFMLRMGTAASGERLLSPSAISAATRNQLECMREVPEIERRCRPWGLGWRLDWPAHSANFGDLLGPRTYGHWGATGTVLWIDPDAGTFALILTTLPQEPSGRYLARLSNAVAAAWE